MAELLLKVGPGASYEDGDVLCAFNDRRIGCVHAEHICHVQNFPFNSDGWRPIGCLAQSFRAATHQYLFRRVTETTIERVNLWTNEVDVFGPESIDVRLYLQRRARDANHCVFGTTGREYWYGGTIDVSATRVALVWDAIERDSPNHRDEEHFKLWPMGRLDIRHHLAVRTTDFDDKSAEDFTAPRLEKDRDGKPVVDAEEREIVLAKRNVRVDWRANLLDELKVTESQVLDGEFAIGRDVVVTPQKMRHESKEQRNQGVEVLERKER